MFSEKHLPTIVKISVLFFIAMLSMFVLSVKVPDTGYIQETLQSIEDSNNKVMGVTGASVVVSVALSALPNDFATPLANSLANMDTYLVLILIVLFIERLIILEGIKIVLAYVIPIVCGLYAFAILLKNITVRNFAYRLTVLSLAVIMAIPVSTHFVGIIASDYLQYVDTTISETQAGAEKITEVQSESNDEQGFLDKISNAFSSAIHGMDDLLDYFNNIIKKNMNSIAILIVTTFVMPLLTCLFFRWLLTELFHITLPVPDSKPHRKDKEDKKESGESES